SNATISGFDTLHRIGSGSLETDVKTLTAIVSFVAGVDNATLSGRLVNTLINIGAEISLTLAHVNASVVLTA
ncbi:unnamed protein product, partial [Allacma fusca]